MERLKALRLPPWFYLLLAICLIGAAHQGFILYRLAEIDRALAHPEGVEVDENTAGILIFAKARRMDQAGDAGEAIRLYSSLRNCKDGELRARAFYNLGVIYLRDAAQRWNARGVLDYARVSTQVELAKENLRESLRLNPDNWDARYNLEFAWRITPPPREKGKADFQGSKSSVFATLPGLPGGGP